MICSVKGLVFLLSKTRNPQFRELLSMPGEKSPNGVPPSSLQRLVKPSGFRRGPPESHAGGQRRSPVTYFPREQPARAQPGRRGPPLPEEQTKPCWHQGGPWDEWMVPFYQPEGPPGGPPWGIPRQACRSPEWFWGAPHYLQRRGTTGAPTDFPYPQEALGHFWSAGPRGPIPWGWHSQEMHWRWHQRTQSAGAAIGGGLLHIHTFMGPEQQGGRGPDEGAGGLRQQQQVQQQPPQGEEQRQLPQSQAETEQEKQHQAPQQLLLRPNNPLPPHHMQDRWHPRTSRMQQQERAYQPRGYRRPLMEVPEAAGRRWMPVGGGPLCEVPLVYPGPPPPTNFQTAGGPPPGTPPAKGHWRLMSFNILAESLVDEKYSKQVRKELFN